MSPSARLSGQTTESGLSDICHRPRGTAARLASGSIEIPQPPTAEFERGRRVNAVPAQLNRSRAGGVLSLPATANLLLRQRLRQPAPSLTT